MRMSINCSIDISDMDKLTQKFMSVLCAQLNTSEESLKAIWNQVQSSMLQVDLKSSDKKEEKKDEKPQASCQAILKRKGEKCGKRVSKNSKTGQYCAIHCKCETSATENAPDLSNYHVFKRNAFENYTYGDTGLILKSKDEQKIIGYQGSNGVIRDLNADEILLCQRRRLEYIANYHAGLAEVCINNKVNTVEHTSKLNFL